jgi:hypothetical protein
MRSTFEDPIEAGWYLFAQESIEELLQIGLDREKEEQQRDQQGEFVEWEVLLNIKDDKKDTSDKDSTSDHRGTKRKGEERELTFKCYGRKRAKILRPADVYQMEFKLQSVNHNK